jgi:hypothetical protein
MKRNCVRQWYVSMMHPVIVVVGGGGGSGSIEVLQLL